MDTFVLLGRYFHQDTFAIYNDIPAVISDFIAVIGKEKTDSLEQYLSTVLSSKSDMELDELWERTGSDLLVTKGTTREFLTIVHDELGPVMA